MPIDHGTVVAGDLIDYSQVIPGYLVNPGTVQTDQGDGMIRVLWGDSEAFSVLPPSHELLAELEIFLP